ncbi:TIGR02217 family protein [Erythrobacteraceae bacterium CFH 75059]|uniref:DUF2460 domain-containing protein n=1 Tax=Qipengyuania thermophila TaxID=2509361 RepID=UPI001021B0C8|nr:DUF2460 domain-containing protein [Qipengyuania thermophila]TCD06842.1 TIGR02217 family protein [Erythrobacteraceae bacterium CFH 75059]
MAFWLCPARTGQHTDHIQRFDPRFWTVNFPRPMMASVVTTAPDGLRVDCEFFHRGELAGLIWDSADALDHPLLAYATQTDYDHCTLRFRWRSAGLIPLDAANGPTLTIEGRDADGVARHWYVRLWNYATGDPEDAVIVLPFGHLQAGFTLPGEAVHPRAIDRMFISLAPPGYAGGSDAPLPQRVNGWAELSEMRCEGRHALLEIGDVLLPVHGEHAATAYDDAFNQTPDRLLRTVRALGYGRYLLHYVGMSHFFRLAPGEGRLLATPDGALCEPALRWHRAYLAGCAAQGFEPILSLSFELLAAHCPDAWQQRADDGTPGRTGWDPPSALLSPASAAAVGWLALSAQRWVALLREAGLPVRFQIGEPWWWIMPDGRPCLYDPAARAALGGDPVAIPSVAGPLDAQQCALLDAAGTLLADATTQIAAAARAAAGPAGAQILLLAFTPTVLDPATPELHRLNLPREWAWPAFDRLQLEDYDWLTAGAEVRRHAALRFVDAKLGYPVARQDYLSGFVLAAADADLFWQRIDAGLDAAAARGVTRRFVWALPQIARDGYVRLPSYPESAMQSIDPVPYPLALGRDTSVAPEFSTTVVATASGHERRTALWADARLQFDVGPGLRSEAELATLLAFFRARHGPARGFLLRDPFDHSSHGMTGTPSPGDQVLGTGDGRKGRFALVKHYGEQRRRITRPEAATVRVSVDGEERHDWHLEPGGIIVFDAVAPPPGAVVRAGFLFDVPVRFAQDRLEISGVAFAAGEAPSVPLVEVREDA